MTQPIIEVKNLSKEYIISHNVQPYYTLRDSLTQLVKKPFKIFSKKHTSNTKEKFLALNDVSFSVMPGEVIGIIGRNGAGKSTLLKILSQITPPSKGSIHLRGRVASLLEVGTGFHPELTGRENIFLNGAILGMTQKEIKNKFNEIVEFSGVEKFLDTPVKRYSSGMYVRLAFAVAAHLEPEILIVDEVLAVGDAEFQKKCLGKMGDIAKKEGRTVLFVSHNMGAIAQLCNRAIVLESGEMVFVGKTDEAVSFYLDKYRTQLPVFQLDKTMLKNENQFISIFNTNSKNQVQSDYKYDDEIKIVIEIYLPQWNDMLEVGLFPCDKLGRRIFMIEIPLKEYYSGDPFMKFEVIIPPKFLAVGDYSWMVFIHNPMVSLYDYKESICNFSIKETGSAFSKYIDYDCGCVCPPTYLINKI